MSTLPLHDALPIFGAVTLHADLVAASNDVAATSSRSRKIAVLADLLRRLDAGEAPIAAGLLSGLPRQGRLGVGYSTIYALEQAPAREASLTIGDLDFADRKSVV